jgi:1-acyl-sn-glycerol-3-phosphate acyltransferase
MLAYFRILLFGFHLTLRLGWLILIIPFIKKKEATMFRHRSRWAKELLSILGIRAHYHGNLDEYPQGLYVSNHRSIIDPALILSRLNLYPLAKAEIDENPLMSLAAKQTGVILVDREKKDSRKRALTEIEIRLGEGKSILIFPEGTTSDEKYFLPFRKGSILKAVELRVPIIPIYLVYPSSDYHWTGGSMANHFIRQFNRLRTEVHIYIGDPIFTNAFEDPTPRILWWMIEQAERRR